MGMWVSPKTAAEVPLNALTQYPCPFYRHDAAEHGRLAAGFSVEQAWGLFALAYNGWGWWVPGQARNRVLSPTYVTTVLSAARAGHGIDDSHRVALTSTALVPNIGA